MLIVLCWESIPVTIWQGVLGPGCVLGICLLDGCTKMLLADICRDLVPVCYMSGNESSGWLVKATEKAAAFGVTSMCNGKTSLQELDTRPRSLRLATKAWP